MFHLLALTFYDEITIVASVPILIIALLVLAADTIRHALDKTDVPFFVATVVIGIIGHSRDEVVRAITFTRGLANADADPIDHILLLPETFFWIKIVTLVTVLVWLGVRWGKRGATDGTRPRWRVLSIVTIVRWRRKAGGV